VGYTTEFEGHVTIDPPLNMTQQELLRDFAGRDHRHESGMPGIYCQWIPTKDGTRLIWDGGEKFYDSVEWMEYLIEHFIAGDSRDRIVFTHERKVNGVIHASGEEPSDVWRLVVTDNVVTVEHPQWG